MPIHYIHYCSPSSCYDVISALFFLPSNTTSVMLQLFTCACVCFASICVCVCVATYATSQLQICGTSNHKCVCMYVLVLKSVSVRVQLWPRAHCELLNGTYISVYIHGMRHGNADCISRLCFALPLATTCYPLQYVYVRLLQATSKPIDIVCTFVAHDSYAAKWQGSKRWRM